MLILDKLSSISIRTVIANGQVVSQEGELTATIPSPQFPEFTRRSIMLKALPTPDDLIVRTKVVRGTVRVRAIGIIPASAYTSNLEVEIPSRNGNVFSNIDEDVMKIAVFERHKASGNKAVGFVKGFGLKEGAVASTVAHDSHNLVIAGTSDQDMIIAAKELIASGGGMIVVRNGRTLAYVALPIAGLMSDKPVKDVAQQVERLNEAWVMLGCTLPSPYMNLALTTLSVIPELRITDKGLLDAVHFKFVSPVIE